MYAVIETGGKQYRAEERDILRVEKLDVEDGSEITLDKVLLIGGEEGVRVGAPYLSGVTVTAKVLRVGKGRKIEGFTFKPKKNQRKRYGHRQWFTELRIVSITA